MTAQPVWVPHVVLLYYSDDAARARIPEVFPAHSAYAAKFRIDRPGALVMIGPFAETSEGQAAAMSIFTSLEAAEAFAADDPFVVEGIATEKIFRTWLVSPDPEG
ncbi:YciI family protein [Prescottella soli]|uniref:YciI family protein n=1 Tax=Prescottella soli TaxID=1543852 RepID=A0ABW9FVL8_9NOCA